MDYYNITSERYVEIAKKTTIHPKFNSIQQRFIKIKEKKMYSLYNK